MELNGHALLAVVASPLKIWSLKNIFRLPPFNHDLHPIDGIPLFNLWDTGDFLFIQFHCVLVSRTIYLKKEHACRRKTNLKNKKSIQQT